MAPVRNKMQGKKGSRHVHCKNPSPSSGKGQGTNRTKCFLRDSPDCPSRASVCADGTPYRPLSTAATFSARADRLPSVLLGVGWPRVRFFLCELPDKERFVLRFSASYGKLLPTSTSMSNPSKESLPKVADDIQQELTSFQQGKLKHTETQEKVILPSKEDVQQEKIHNTLLHGVEHFEKQNLNHAETQEKVCLPNKQDIETEKEHKQIIEGIETFDASKLKHAETQERNVLPTKEVIEQEKAA